MSTRRSLLTGLAALSASASPLAREPAALPPAVDPVIRLYGEWVALHAFYGRLVVTDEDAERAALNWEAVEQQTHGAHATTVGGALCALAWAADIINRKTPDDGLVLALIGIAREVLHQQQAGTLSTAALIGGSL